MSTRNIPTARRNAGGRLDLLDVTHTSVCYRPCETIFAQGDRCAAVMYLRKGGVKLTATSRAGREAVIGIIHAGEFFGEGALAGQRRRTCTAETVTASTIAMVKTGEMRRRLHEGAGLSDWFRSHMLARNIRMEGALIGQLFNRCEKRLARVLLLLANFDEHQLPRAALPTISRNLLAEAIGASRSKVDLLMNEFRKLGFLERNGDRDGGMQVHRSMLTVVLED
jgi:CRP/FNR family transcriptional regulator, cyclic AMP receptor protein